MNKYHIYQNSKGQREAVKQGFCWPGFFFSFIWLGSARLWLRGLVLGSILFLTVLGIPLIEDPSMTKDDTLIHLVAMALAFYVGWSGNQWQEEKLNLKGFKKIRTVEATSSQAALKV